MNKYLKYFLILAGIGIIVFIVSWFIVFAESDVSVKNNKADFELQASDIISQFETDEDSANKQYLGKVILVSGILDSFKETDTEVTLYLKQDNDLSGILCSFNKSSIDISILKKGDQIKIKGVCTGYLIDVVLNKCAIIE